MNQSLYVSFIIVNYNTEELIVECISSIYKYCNDLQFEIIVVDNASLDNSVDKIKNSFSDVKIIESKTNLGFARANNKAAKIANGKYLILLNPDTSLTKNAIQRMVNFLEKNDNIGIIGPKLVDANGTTQISSFGFFPSITECLIRAFRIYKFFPNLSISKKFLIKPDGNKEITEVSHLLGACFVIKKDFFSELKGFDERFFLFLEETDLCKRVLQKQKKIVYYTKSEIIHYGEQSMQNMLDRSGGLYIRSYNKYIKKHGANIITIALINIFLVLGVLCDAVVSLIKYKSFKRFLQTLKAFWYGYIKSPIPKGVG
ncbi:MAG: glycosyltransferase family 2 protein [Armatimonadota bacterium]